MRFHGRLTAFLLLLIPTGCTVGPDYVPPKPQMPEAWSAAAEEGLTPQPPAQLAQWWKTLGDSELDSLIERAVVSNLDLRLAESRVREARALRGFEASRGLPQVDANGSYSRNRASENVGEFGANRNRDTNLYQAGFDAGWEVDVFGGIRRSVEAADADVAAADERTRDVLVSLLAEVARNYVEARGFQQRLVIAHNNMQTQREAVDIAQRRFDVGLTSELDATQARAQLAATESQIPNFESSLSQSIHRLGVLLGQQPGTLLAELSEQGPIPTTPPEVRTGLPSELLRRRPDIRAAERDLAAANARIGAATAELFPHFSLLGSIGLSSTQASNFFDASSVFWSAGPSMTWSVFNSGRVHSQIAVEDARTEQALIRFEQAVLTSLEEVENALVAYAKELVRRRSLVRAVEANLLAVDLSREQYTRGLVAFLNVLDAQRSLYLTQDALVQSDRNVAANLIALYKALGGGWEPDEVVQQ